MVKVVNLEFLLGEDSNFGPFVLDAEAGEDKLAI